MDAQDRKIINLLQGGFPICERPYAEVALQLGLSEEDLLARIRRMLEQKILSRFGPMYHAERLGGGLTLAAMQVPEAHFDEVCARVNEYPEVAHNYQRDHALNMWFVLATEAPGDIERVVAEIEAATGYKVYNMPKQQEFFVGLKFDA